MTQKHVVIVFLVILLIGLGGAAMTAVSESGQPVASPTPTPAELFPARGSSQAVGVLDPSLSPRPVSKQTKRYQQYPGDLTPRELARRKAVIETTKGNIEFSIYPEATKAASNFIFLARDGFYNGLTFHRVEPGLLIQGGDPLGNGTGNPGYSFEDEPVTKPYSKGTVAMANAGPDTNGSQFFILLQDYLSLPPSYTIFGKVTSGLEVASKIAPGDAMMQVKILTFP